MLSVSFDTIKIVDSSAREQRPQSLTRFVPCLPVHIEDAVNHKFKPISSKSLALAKSIESSPLAWFLCFQSPL